MGATGTKKLPPKNMKTKTATQYCIDGFLVDEVLDNLPTGIKIIGAKVTVGKAFSKHRIVTPNKLKALGVTTLQEHRPAKEAHLVFDECKAKTIRENVKEVARIIDGDATRASFLYLTVTNGKATGKFQKTTKEIRPDETDMRRKLIVLGLTDADGKITSLVSDLSAKKYECRIQMTEVRTIICSKIG